MYVGEKGPSVIHYVVVNERIEEGIQEMRIGNRTESDHLPLEVKIQGPTIEEREKRREKRIHQMGLDKRRDRALPEGDKVGNW